MMNHSFLRLTLLCVFVSFSLLISAQRIVTSTGPAVSPNPSELGANICDRLGNITTTLTIGSPNAVDPNQPTGITFASQIPALQLGVLYYQNIVLYGKLIVDVDLTFGFCNVKMNSPDAEIELVNSKKISAFYSNFYSCNSMWRGFFVHQNCTLGFYACGIEDAENAILADNNAILNILSSTFNRNYID